MAGVLRPDEAAGCEESSGSDEIRSRGFVMSWARAALQSSSTVAPPEVEERGPRQSAHIVACAMPAFCPRKDASRGPTAPSPLSRSKVKVTAADPRPTNETVRAARIVEITNDLVLEMDTRHRQPVRIGD